jgi:predicted PurR-regulated permease PerM
MILVSSSRAILTLYPKYEARFMEIYIFIARFFELHYDEHLSFFENVWGQIGVRNQVMAMTFSISNALLVFLANAFLVAIFMIFLLLEAAFFKDKLNRAFEGERAEQIKRITSGVLTQVTRYLSVKTIISMLNGVTVGVGLAIIGVEFALVWGVVQFVFNYIPNIGSIAVAFIATVFSLAQFWPSPMPVIATIIVFLVNNLVYSYFLEPKITGDRLGLSPFVVLVSLLIWGWIWGFAGLILAVPMMAIIKIVCENVPMLEPISILLGSHKAAKAAKSVEEPSTESDAGRA